MRLRTEFWVKGYLRRCAVEGASAVVVRHGDDDAGAIFIKVNRLDGTCLVFGPAPAGLAGAESDRRWVACLAREGVSEAVADTFLAREAGLTPISGLSRSRIARVATSSTTSSSPRLCDRRLSGDAT